ncbi:MAG: hypothetical protein LBO70_08575 [Clostridiales Family XIII bacterium]|jgi:hypothetical protein|nr:hypothetical protein [Clostridiales Family XIII bacterium]
MAGVKKNKELNLLIALERGQRWKKGGRGAATFIIFVAVVAVAVVCFYMYMSNETSELTERRDIALAYVNNPEVQAQYDESLARQQEAKTAQARTEAIISAADAVDSYPDMSGSDMQNIFRIAGGKVNMSGITYDRTTGVFSFGARCQSATHVPIFIAALRASGVFSDVNYDGYAVGTYTAPGESHTTPDGAVIETQVTLTEYSFSVTCIVAVGGE